MKKFICFSFAVMALITLSCSKTESVYDPSDAEVTNSRQVVTKSIGNKTPSTFVYVETNDVNPLNAMDYYLDDGYPFFDYVCFFAANIHATTVNGVTQPTLYFNPELTPYLCNNGTPISTYTAPFHEQDQEVILGVLPDWQGIGFSNMTTTQQEQFATILACVVNHCGFDGVLFDDEYSGTNSVVNGSYSGIITKFKALCPNKKVFVFDWGGTNNISSTAAALVEDFHHGYFNYYLPISYCNVSGVTASQWSPISLQLGSTYSSTALNTIQNWGAQAVTNGYGQAMFYNLRATSASVDPNAVDPTPVLSKIATGAGWETPVTCEGGDQAQLPEVAGGCTVTYNMALNCE